MSIPVITLKSPSTITHDLGGFNLCYLATPYSKFPDGMDHAHTAACLVAAELIRRRVVVVCPIVHSHAIAAIGGLNPLNRDLWMRQDERFMRAASCCIVAMLPGWRESEGVQWEIAWFRARRTTIHYLELDYETRGGPARLENEHA